jgi:hypothetical protein
MVRSDPLGRRSLYLQAHASRIEARSSATSDETTERDFKSSIGSFREIGFPFWMAVALLEFGEWLDGRDRGTDAAPLVTEARAIFDGLQAKPWIDRADRITQGARASS